MDSSAPLILGNGVPAPYGQACENCAQSKRKCILRGAGSCERCSRQNVECKPAKLIRRRGPRKHPISKTARIEEKLDGLMSLLKAGQQPNPESLKSLISESSSASTASVNNDTKLSSAYTPPTTHDSPDTSGESFNFDAEKYLQYFQTFNLRYFPFVYIPPTMTAAKLREERPFLWLCIMAVSSRSAREQAGLHFNIRQRVAQELVVQLDKSLDMLLGLLTIIAWPHYSTHRKMFLALLSQLAISLVFDLGLNRHVLKELPVVYYCWNSKTPKPAWPPAPRTNEERRAVLGCFLITSIISSFLQKTDALRWTSHMDECVRILEEVRECPLDATLIQQVRLQLLVEQKSLGVLHDRILKPTGAEEVHQNLHAQLHETRTRLKTQSQPNEMIMILHSYSAELDLISPTFLHNTQTTLPETSMSQALQSIKTWFSIFLTISPSDYVGFPISITSQIVRFISTCNKLTTTEDLVWDWQSIWPAKDMLAAFDQTTDNLEKVASVVGLDTSGTGEKDLFWRSAQMTRSLRPGVDQKVGPDELQAAFIEQDAVDAGLRPDGYVDDMFDNDWLMELLYMPNNSSF